MGSNGEDKVLRHDGLSKPVILSVDGKNLIEMEGKLGQILELKAAPELLDSRWGQTTSRRPKTSKIDQLNEMYAKAAQELGIPRVKVEAMSHDEMKAATEKQATTKGDGRSKGDGKSKAAAAAEPTGGSVSSDDFVLISDPMSAGASCSVYYLDPMTGNCETDDFRKIRIAVWMWLGECLSHHVRLVTATEQYNVHALMLLLHRTFGGSTKQIAVQNVIDMVALTLGTGRDGWPTMCGAATNLASRQAAIKDKRYTIAPGLLPAFMLRALDVEPQFSVQVAALREREAKTHDLDVGHVVTTINVRHAQLDTSSHRASLHGHYTANDRGGGKGGKGGKGKGGRGGKGGKGGRGGKLGECWNFAAGSCNYGSTCKFTHAPQPPDTVVTDWKNNTRQSGCYECGLPHRWSECPKKLAREGREAAQSEEIKSMRASMTATAAATAASIERQEKQWAQLKAAGINGTLASLNPYASGTEMDTIFHNAPPGGAQRQ